MSIFKRFFGGESRAEGQTEITPEVSAELLRALVGSDEMTAEKALEIPAFSMAVDFISSTAAMLPIKLYREDTEAHTTEEITDDRRLFLLNDEANSIMGAAACRRAQVRDMLIYGGGFLYIKQDKYGEVESLHYVKKSDVSVQTNAHPIFKDFNIYVGGRGYLPFNFVILARNSPDGVTGIGAVEEHKTLLSAMYSTMKYEAVISKTGGNKKGFLQSERILSESAMNTLKQTWRDLYANNENNMMVLNNGVKYVPSASTSVEMQLNENKRTNSEQIAQIFGLSPKVLSGSCSTAEYMSAVRTAVLPVVEQIQAALNQSLLTEEEKGTYYFVLDTTELLKGDTLSRYQAYEIALRNNFLQLDEVRYLEDKKPIGFDFLKLGLNDVLLDPKTNTVYTPNMNALMKLGENSLTQEELRAIMEYRKKNNWVKGDKGRFAGSVPIGGSGKMVLTNSMESDIINERDDKPIMLITESTIDRVSKIKPFGYSDVQCDIIQSQHQELLRFSKNNNESKEVAFVFDANLSNRHEYKGTEDKLKFDGGLSGSGLFVMHNHPRNNSFSDTDVALLLSNDGVKTLSIVKNSGSVETLTKTDKFKKSELILDFKRQYKKYVKTGADSEIDKAIEKFFQRNKEGLEWKKT